MWNEDVVYLMSLPIYSCFPVHLELGRLSSWRCYYASFAQTIKTTPQLRLCRNDQLPCANLWAPWYCESDSRECERDTGKKGSKKCHSVTLLLVKNFYWDTSQHDPKATSTAEPIKLQGNKAVTVQKTLCGALWSPNTVTWYSLERNHTRN